MPAESLVSAEAANLLEGVLGIWREVLDCGDDTLEADSNFFLLGGDSLQLTRVLVRIRERFGVDLPLREVTRFSTPAKMARCCTNRQGCVPPASSRVQEPRDEASFPCTATQTALWLAEQCGDGGGVYNAAVLLHMRGNLRVPVLMRALRSLVERHEVLRGTLRFDTRERRLFAVVGVGVPPMPEPLAMKADAARRYLTALAAQPFDLAAGPLWRCQLVAAGDGAWLLLICMHHSITDGWSGGVLLQHLAEAYEALLMDFTWKPPVEDREFRRFCRQQHPPPSEDLRWWRATLDGADALPTWPSTDGARWPFTMACEEQAIDAQLLMQVHVARKAAGVELSAFLFTALRLALRALTGLDDLCIGMPVNLRNASAQETSVGCFINLLVLRERIGSGKDGLALLRQVQHGLSEALCRRTMSLPELAQCLQPKRLPSGNAWCDALFVFQNVPDEPVAFTSLELAVETLTLPAQYPLKVEFLPRGEACCCRIEYARAVLSPAGARDLQAAIRHQLAFLSAPARSS